MALNGCYAVLKYIVLFVNLIVWLAGVLILGLSIWLLVDSQLYMNVVGQDANNYFTGTYIFLAAGALMTVIGFLGCCGALRESQCMLCGFFVALLLILVAQAAALVWAYVHRDDLEKMVRESMRVMIKDEYSIDPAKKETVDKIQKGLECCGADRPLDWAGSKYNGMNGPLNFTLSGLTTYKVPTSCCRENEASENCQKGTQLEYAKEIRAFGFSLGNTPSATYEEGCTNKVIAVFMQYMPYIAGIVIGIGVLELLGMIVSLTLCCAVRSVDRYKA